MTSRQSVSFAGILAATLVLLASPATHAEEAPGTPASTPARAQESPATPVPPPAPAQESPGFYISGFLGLAILEDTDVDDGGALFTPNGGSASFSPGGTVGGALGWYLIPSIRLEGEVAFRRNELDEFELSGFAFDAGGSIASLSLMANGFYDIDLGGMAVPYFGGGVGFAIVGVSDVEFTNLLPLIGSDGDSVFAYQLVGGVALQLQPTMALTFEYRYFGTDQLQFTDDFGDPFIIDYTSHNLSVGIRIRF